jgi:hypothetical protein
MAGADELREPLRFADDDDSDDLGGFSGASVRTTMMKMKRTAAGR